MIMELDFPAISAFAATTAWNKMWFNSLFGCVHGGYKAGNVNWEEED